MTMNILDNQLLKIDANMVYGYLRVSSDAQDVNSQRQGVESFAAARGWTIEKYITDEGVSGGKDPDKRNLGPMLKGLRKGDVVICSEISRLGRDLYMVMDILHFCMARGVVIHTVKDGFTLGDSIQSKVLAFAFGLSAEIERQMIRQRTKEGLALRRKMGVLMGRPLDDKPVNTRQRKRMTKYKDLILGHYKAGVPQNEIARLFQVDRDTLRRYIIEWGEYVGEDGTCVDPKRRREDTSLRRRRAAAGGRWDNPRLDGIDRDRLAELILEDKTLPVIAREFPDFTYDEVYDRVLFDKELNNLYRAHGHRIARRDYGTAKSGR